MQDLFDVTRKVLYVLGKQPANAAHDTNVAKGVVKLA